LKASAVDPVLDFQSAFKNQQSAIPVVERALLS
jgi:hypothetical protein